MTATGDPYDALAPHYREYASKRDAYLSSVDAFVRQNMPARRESLLDVGSGDGLRAMALAAACGMGRVVLSDASAEMAARCRTLGAAAVWQVAAEALPDDGERFDVITCLWNVLGHLANSGARLSALGRMRNLLAPAGRLFLDVQNRHNAAAYGRWRVYGRMLLDAAKPDERRGDTRFDWKVGDKRVRGAGHLFTPAEIHGLIEAAGLRIVRRAAVNYATGRMSASALDGQLAFVCEAAGA